MALDKYQERHNIKEKDMIIKQISWKSKILICTSFILLVLSIFGCNEDDSIDDSIVIHSVFDVTDPTDSQQVASYSADETINPEDWYFSDYDPSSETFIISVIDSTSNGWIIRSADGQSYARVKVSTLSVELDPESKSVVFSYELWDGSVWTTAENSPELNYTTTKAYWDMETNSLSDLSNDWDLAISDVQNEYLIEVNGGNFGEGQGGIGVILITE